MTVPLAEVPVAFCDSISALQQAWADGLPATARIRTASPALNAAGFQMVEPLDRERPADIGAYWQAGAELTRRIHSKLESCRETAPLALLAARSGLITHRALQKAMYLGEEDFVEPRAALYIDTATEEQDKRLNAPWQQFLAGHERFVARRYTVQDLATAETGDARIPLRLKFRNFDLPRGQYFASLSAGKLLAVLQKFGIRPKTVLVYRQNELVEDVAATLLRHGFVARRLATPKPSPSDIIPEVSDQIGRQLRTEIEAFLDRWFASALKPAALSIFERDISNDVGTYLRSTKDWRLVLSQHNHKNHVVLTNFPGGAQGLALAHVCNSMQIPFVATQHGVTREISADHRPIEAHYENGAGDLYLTFNDRARDLTDESPYASGSCVTAGRPRAYARLRQIARRSNVPPVLYVSTALMKGNVNFATGSISDIERIDRECSIVNSVLARLPATVLYKDYPSLDRYADASPLHRQIDKHDNIELYRQSTDLRFFVGEHQVIVTARATSTIGWCISVDRPLVVINYPDDSSFTPEALSALDAGLFLFQWSENDMFERLRTFLSRPVQDIRSEWKNKVEARAELIRDFFFQHPTDAGRRGANAILRRMSTLVQ